LSIVASIITVYYDTPEEIKKLSASLQNFLEPSSYEWIIADNHSQQDLSGQIANAKYLRMAENFGFGKACNIAAREATAPYLFFLNPDCELTQDCVTPLIAGIQASAAAAPLVLNPDGSIQLSFGPFLSIWNEAVQKHRTRNESSARIQKWLRAKTEAQFHPDYVSGCALMISADAFKKVGGFDENFFLYEEDVDLCKRLREAGHTVTYVPEARVIHARNRSTSKDARRSRTEYLKSQAYYYRKHHGAFQNALLRVYRLIS
jgi:hypothetical protein